MINFRYHVVSLVAVFLALAVGVVMGYGVLGQPTVRTLRNRINTVNNRIQETRNENQQLRDELDRANSTLESMAPFAGTDRLPSVSIVVLAVRDVGTEVAENTVTLARRAGADAPGIVWLESKWALREDGDPAALAKALGLPITRKAALRDQGYRALVRRLVEGPPATGDDVLTGLVTQGFLSIDAVGNDNSVGVAELGGFGTRALLVDGTSTSQLPRNVAGPLARAAVDAGLPLVVGEDHDDEAGRDRGVLLNPVLDTDALARQVSTVDDLERPEGQTAAVLALADLGRSVIGHYGYGDGADSSLPEWSQP